MSIERFELLCERDERELGDVEYDDELAVMIEQFASGVDTGGESNWNRADGTRVVLPLRIGLFVDKLLLGDEEVDDDEMFKDLESFKLDGDIITDENDCLVVSLDEVLSVVCELDVFVLFMLTCKPIVIWSNLDKLENMKINLR